MWKVKSFTEIWRKQKVEMWPLLRNCVSILRRFHVELTLAESRLKMITNVTFAQRLLFSFFCVRSSYFF